MPSPFTTVCFLSIVSSSISLNLPANPSPLIAPNPLPPPPPRPPIGPYNYPIRDTSLTIKVLRPYGEDLPHVPTLVCLVSAQSKLDRQIAINGDTMFPRFWEFDQDGIALGVMRIDPRTWTSTIIAALRGMIGIMTEYPEPGTKEMNVVVLHSGNGVMGKIEITKHKDGVAGTSSLRLNGTNSAVEITDLKVLDPKNFWIPNTSITISLENSVSNPPYGPPLPPGSLVIALASASAEAGSIINKYGDAPIPNQWPYKAGGIGINFHPQKGVECKLSVVQTVLLGLADLVLEPGGVGAVAVDFVVKVEGKGVVATGKLSEYKGKDTDVDGVSSTA